jgi:PAS domain S-box-containing protein
MEADEQGTLDADLALRTVNGPVELPPAVLADVAQTVLERSGTGVVLFDADLRYVMANQVAAEINGVAVEDHLGRTVHEVVPDVAREYGPILRQVLHTGRPAWNVEAVGETSSQPGRRRWWTTNVVRLDRHNDSGPYVLVVFTEVTQQHAAHRRLRSLIDNLFTFVGLLSPAGDILELNRAATTAAGVELQEVAGTPFWSAPWWRHDPALSGRVRQAVMTAARGETVRFDVSVSLSDDVVIPIDFQLAPIVDGHEVTALVPSGLDITARVDEAHRLESLAQLSHRLNAAETYKDVACSVVATSGALEDAGVVEMAVVDRVAGRLWVSGPSLVAEGGRYLNRSIDSDEPSSPHAPSGWFDEVLRSTEPVVVRSRADITRGAPPGSALVEGPEPELVVALPLHDDRGEQLGAVWLGWSSVVRPSDASWSRLALLQLTCASALQRASRAGIRAELVTAMQEEVLRPHRNAAGLDLAVEYRPAVNEIGFGGDWYDVVTADRHIALVVGDVVGHGVGAASRMAELKGFLRGMLLSSPLEHVLSRTTAGITDHDQYLATAAVVLVDAAARSVRCALAGHPPPVVRYPGGRTELLGGGLGPPLGVAGEADAPVTTVLPHGTMLVLYTDGLVERRDQDLHAGLAQLRDVVSAVPDETSAEFARSVVIEQMIGDRPHADDVAIVIVRFAGGDGGFEVSDHLADSVVL